MLQAVMTVDFGAMPETAGQPKCRAAATPQRLTPLCAAAGPDAFADLGLMPSSAGQPQQQEPSWQALGGSTQQQSSSASQPPPVDPMAVAQHAKLAMQLADAGWQSGRRGVVLSAVHSMRQAHGAEPACPLCLLGSLIKLDIAVLAGSMTAKLICGDALTKTDFSSKVTIFTA